jgi:ATP-binding cassette subfamily C protein
MLETLRKCLTLIPHAMRWRWAGLIPLVVVTATLETVGTAGIFALMKILSDPAQAYQLPIIGALYRALSVAGDREVVLVFTLIVALFYIAKNCLAALNVYLQSKLTGASTAALANALLHGYLNAPYAFYFRRNSAELIRNTTDSSEAAFRLVLVSGISVVSELLVFFGIVVVLMAAVPTITLFALAALLLVLVLLLKLSRRIFTRLGSREQELKREILKSLQQSLGGVKEVKVLGRERFFFDDFTTRHGALTRLRSHHFTLSAAPRLLIETIFITGMLFVISSLVMSSEVGTLMPQLGLFAYAGVRLIPSASRTLVNLNNIRFGSSVTQRLYNDYVQCASALDPYPTTRTEDEITFTDRVDITHLTYTYEESSHPVLTDISLTIRRGETIGIVGPTGAGKSTLIDLLLGLLSPSTGGIFSDGKNIALSPHSWRAKIGYVPQSIFLIDDTIRRNIALGVKDKEINEQQLWTAIRLAQLEDYVHSLPLGLNTIVGERGVRLSGGQRQRIAIARALYHEPELLMFDEATSALDNQTEREVIQAIEALRGKKTLVIVAHRLSTVRSCDFLVFLKDGKIAAGGTFDELLARNEDFRGLAAVPDVGAVAEP